MRVSSGMSIISIVQEGRDNSPISSLRTATRRSTSQQHHKLSSPNSRLSLSQHTLASDEGLPSSPRLQAVAFFGINHSRRRFSHTEIPTVSLFVCLFVDDDDHDIQQSPPLFINSFI